MLNEADLARINTSVAEQMLRQPWRLRTLWVLRILSLIFLVLVVRAALQWPFDSFSEAVDRCLATPSVAQARTCVITEAEARRSVAADARRNVLALLGLLSLTLALALMVRFAVRRQLEEHVRFSGQVFDAVPLQLALRTPSGHFLRVNAAFEKRYGLKQADLVGRHSSEFFPADGVRKLEAVDALALAREGPVEVEGEVPGPDGPEQVIFRLQAVRAEDRTAVGLILVRQDVSELRRREAELTAANEKLRRLSAQMIDAQESERRRIARDLHDEVGQILTALKLQLGMVSKRGAIPDAAEALLLVREFAEEALRHTRDLSASLHPHHLDDLGLESALSWLVDRFIRPLVPTVDLRCRVDPVRGPQEVELVAFRVVQEALTNAARHARATRIGVILETAEGNLTIEVIDDGVGFDDVEAKRGTSLGLTGMSDRVGEIGGELMMDSTPGLGTRVHAKLPWVTERVAA